MKRLLFGIFAIGSISAPSASALELEQDAGRPATVDSSIEQGFRISDSGDFKIVEHGHWSPPYRPQLAELTATDGGYPTHRKTAQKKLKNSQSNFRRAAFLRDVYAAEARFRLPHGLLDALIWAESRYNPLAVSSAGAAGLGQLMPGTARDLGVLDRFDPQANIHGAARYLRQMLDRFGMVHLALAAYNAGPGAVKKAKGIPLNRETPSYVRSVLDRWGLQ